MKYMLVFLTRLLPLWLRPKIILALQQRASQWRAIRQAHLTKEPACAACGRTAGLAVHHVVPVSFDERKQLDPHNLLTLCAHPCHLVFGHLGSYHCYNPDVRRMTAEYRRAVAKRLCLKDDQKKKHGGM